MRAALCLLLVLLGGDVFASDSLPPKPADYVDDTAGILSADTRSALVQRLAQFERDTSEQILVATFPKVPDDYAMEDFTQRTAEAWGVGQKARDNGAVFFIFPMDHKMRIEVGYGLEGAIPDATAKSILDSIVRPAFRSGDFDGGVARGVDAILQAAQGEYKGTGRTVAEREGGDSGLPILLIIFGIAVVTAVIRKSSRLPGGWDYTGRGARRRRNIFWGGGGGWSSGGGGGSDFGGGGFSGGGGSFGGGGASGGW